MARRRLTVFHYRDVIERLRRNEPRATICEILRLHPREITRLRALAAESGWLNPLIQLPSDEELIKTCQTTPRTGSQASIVEPHRATVEKWYGKGMLAKTIYSALKRDHGYKGSYGSVQRFVRKLKQTLPEPIVRLQFGPGEVAQVDFGSGPKIADSKTGALRKTWFFVMTLCHSRHQYAELVWDQTVETWLRCHRNAFEFFVGVVGKVVIDNPKCAITRACYYDPEVQRSYGELARGYGFIIGPCVIETPEHKGRVEAGVKYVKGSFLNSPRNFRSLPDANEQLMQWILEEAGQRIHGTTHQVPLQVFAEEEKAALKPLPAEPVELAAWKTAKLHPDCHVQFAKCYYLAPFRFIGQDLDLRATPAMVTLWDKLTLVASHPRGTRPGQWMTNLDHLPPEKTAYLRETPQWCLEQARTVGENCHEFVATLIGDGILDRLRAAQGLLRLRRKYGSSRLEDACRRAISFDNYRYNTVKRILEQGLDQRPIDEGEGGQMCLAIVDAPRFARNISDLFRRN